MENPIHICLDLFEIEYNLDKTELLKLLSDLISKLELTPIGEPVVTNFGEHAYTAIQVLQESLLDIHTYYEHRAVYLSLFSCKKFNIANFVIAVKTAFGAKKVFASNVARTSLEEALHVERDLEEINQNKI
jgi:S-adenosylmethionine/arginine decarboxylase-like enzyme